MFGDLDWPLNASRGFVSMSRASCWLYSDIHETLAPLAEIRVVFCRSPTCIEHLTDKQKCCINIIWGYIIESWTNLRRWSPADAAWLTPRTRPHMCYHAKFGRSGSNRTIWRSAENGGGPRIPPFKVTQDHWKIKINRLNLPPYFLAVIHSNYGPISYRLWDKRRFRSRIEKNSYPIYLTPPLEILWLRWGSEN